MVPYLHPFQQEYVAFFVDYSMFKIPANTYTKKYL